MRSAIVRGGLVGVLVAGSALFAGAMSSTASADAELVWTATIAERSIDDADRADPLELTPANATPATLTVENVGDEDVVVRSVRVEGRILGMAFYVYTTRLDLAVPAGDPPVERNFELDLADLESQVTGLIPSKVILLDQEGNAIDSRGFAVDVQGSMMSVYGIFGLAVAGMTALLLIGVLVALARGRLPENRWQRATAFAVPGIGVGFVLTFTLSAVGLLVPSPTTWALFLVIGGLVGFAVGYLTPTPEPAPRESELVSS